MLLPILLIVGCLLETTVDAEIVELFKVTASDAAVNDGFGRSVAISGDKAVVGATSGSGLGAQAAYVFDVSTGQQLVKLTPSETTPLAFGSSVGISGDVAIVGSPGGRASGGHVNSAYLFDVTTGQELSRLTPSDGELGERGDAFGLSVAIDGNTAIVGAKHHNSTGAAYLFDVTTGEEILKLTASDAAVQDWFGYSVAISGNIAIIGAPWKGRLGAAYLFDVTSGVQLAKLTPSGLLGTHSFGWSVGINDDIAVVAIAYSRSAYLFDATTGDQLFELPFSDSRLASRSVDISGNIAIVGVGSDDEACPAESGCNSGAAHLFDVTTGQQIAKLTASDAMRGARFGASVAISGETVIVGAPNGIGGAALPGPGAAYLFRVPEPSSFALTVLTLAGLLGCSRPRRQQWAKWRCR